MFGQEKKKLFATKVPTKLDVKLMKSFGGPIAPAVEKLLPVFFILLKDEFVNRYAKRVWLYGLYLYSGLVITLKLGTEYTTRVKGYFR